MFRRLFVGRFVQSLQAVGLDQEDACQEMILGLLRKDASPRSRWDPSRGGLSTWMYVAMRGLTLNMIQAAQRAQAKAGPGEEADAAIWARCEASDPTDALYLAELEAVRRRAPPPPAQPSSRQHARTTLRQQRLF